jgi:two-component system, OmpR family, response regulator MprA
MSQDTRVLVVDDDPEIREIVATALEDDGYTVETASDGVDALRKVSEHEPDAVILDAMMPIMSGWEFLATWRTRPAEHRAPVLVVSAVRDWRTALDAGAQGYLSKPFDLDALEAALESVLRAA